MFFIKIWKKVAPCLLLDPCLLLELEEKLLHVYYLVRVLYSALEVPQKKYLVPVPVPLFKKELVPNTVHV